jgi:anti-anti-sigma factor
VYRDGPGLTVQVAGELDVTSAVTLRRALRALDRASRPIGVDLSAVCFADSYGLEPLAESAVHRSRVGQPPLHVLALSPSAERIVSLLGLDWSETVCGDEWVNGNRPDE